MLPSLHFDVTFLVRTWRIFAPFFICFLSFFSFSITEKKHKRVWDGFVGQSGPDPEKNINRPEGVLGQGAPGLPSQPTPASPTAHPRLFEDRPAGAGRCLKSPLRWLGRQRLFWRAQRLRAPIRGSCLKGRCEKPEDWSFITSNGGQSSVSWCANHGGLLSFPI